MENINYIDEEGQTYMTEIEKKELDIEIKGKNPYFFDDPNIDRLVTMLMELASELSVTRDRLDTHQRLLESKGIYLKNEIEDFSPSTEEMKSREEWRSKFLDRVLNALYTKYDEK